MILLLVFPSSSKNKSTHGVEEEAQNREENETHRKIKTEKIFVTYH